MTLQDAATRIAARSPADAPKLDIAIILDILEQLIPILRDVCEITAEALPERAARVTVREKIYLRMRARNAVGRQLYQSIGGGQFVDNMVDEASATHPTELQGLWYGV